jgi:hypothetical protein
MRLDPAGFEIALIEYQSVAHMPAKAMTYKFLNTFIVSRLLYGNGESPAKYNQDDLFAFTIKMPTLHRLATLRDDVIFFIYLYQSWKYKVDYTRVNEFGQGGEEEEEVQSKKVEAPLTTPAEGDASTVAVATGIDKEKGGKKRK